MAARAVLVLGIVVFLGAVAHFVYLARIQALCSDTNSELLTSQRWFKLDPADCVEGTQGIDLWLQLDAITVLVSIVLLIGAGVTLSHVPRRTKRVVLMTELAVLVLAVVYGLLWFFTVYLERTQNIQH